MRHPARGQPRRWLALAVLCVSLPGLAALAGAFDRAAARVPR